MQLHFLIIIIFYIYKMENNLKTSTKADPLLLQILDRKLPLPPGSTIRPYTTQYKKKPSKQTLKKKRYTNFTYYKVGQSLIKILMLDQQRYLLVSHYPFVKQIHTIHKLDELHNLQPTRITICQSLLIGQLNNNVVTRKLLNCRIDEKNKQIDTVQDHFEELLQSNKDKYEYLTKHLAGKKQFQTSSIRVIVSQNGEQAQIIDYELFFIQKEYTKGNYRINEDKKIEINEKGVKVQEQVIKN